MYIRRHDLESRLNQPPESQTSVHRAVKYNSYIYLSPQVASRALCHFAKIHKCLENARSPFAIRCSFFNSSTRWMEARITASHSRLPTGQRSPKESLTGSHPDIRHIPREASIIRIYLVYHR